MTTSGAARHHGRGASVCGQCGAQGEEPCVFVGARVVLLEHAFKPIEGSDADTCGDSVFDPPELCGAPRRAHQEATRVRDHVDESMLNPIVKGRILSAEPPVAVMPNSGNCNRTPHRDVPHVWRFDYCDREETDEKGGYRRVDVFHCSRCLVRAVVPSPVGLLADA